MGVKASIAHANESGEGSACLTKTSYQPLVVVHELANTGLRMCVRRTIVLKAVYDKVYAPQ